MASADNLDSVSLPAIAIGMRFHSRLDSSSRKRGPDSLLYCHTNIILREIGIVSCMALAIWFPAWSISAPVPRLLWVGFRLKRLSGVQPNGRSFASWPTDQTLYQRPAPVVPLVLNGTTISSARLMTPCGTIIRVTKEDKTNLSRDGLNPAHVPC